MERTVVGIDGSETSEGPDPVELETLDTDTWWDLVRSRSFGRFAVNRHGSCPLVVFHHTGWSVLVEGLARWLYEEQDTVAVETWAPGDRPYVVRLTPTRVTGRRIQLHQLATDARGYR